MEIPTGAIRKLLPDPPPRPPPVAQLVRAGVQVADQGESALAATRHFLQLVMDATSRSVAVQSTTTPDIGRRRKLLVHEVLCMNASIMNRF
jgi:hypothetical protein